MKYRSITISGPVAAGTTSAAKTLAQKLNLEYYSAGEFFRKYSKEHNIPLPNKEKIPDDVEKSIDYELENLLASSKPIIVDGLYAGYFARNMPHVLKVKLTASEGIRIKRALERGQDETTEDVKRRDKAHDHKFRKLYANEDFLDSKFFDIIINTTNTPIEKVVEAIAKKFKSGI